MGTVHITGHLNTHDLSWTKVCGRPGGARSRPPEMAQAPGGYSHTAFPLITLEILEDMLKIFSMSEPCRSSLHFSSSSSLEAPQEEQVWLAVGIQCQARRSRTKGPSCTDHVADPALITKLIIH